MRPAALLAQAQLIQEVMKEAMKDGEHYGVIPGTKNPALLKPGAEMLLGNMGLYEELSDAQPAIQDFDGRDHGGEPFIYYRRVCRIYRQVGPTEHERVKVAQAEGSCSSWEPKYRYRNEQRVCPQCGKAAIIKGKEEYGGGFICFKKKDGCGAKFSDNDPAITGQAQGKVANPDVMEIDNTILKMADKRALVAATLLATGCSDIFTQDIEDFTPPADAPPEPPKPRARAPEPPATPGPSVEDYMAAWERAGRPESTGRAFMAKHGGTIAGAMAALEKMPDAEAAFRLDPEPEKPTLKAVPDEDPAAKERRRMRAIAKDKGISDDVRRATMIRLFGKTSSKDLSFPQLVQLNGELENWTAP
jgi:hypothetical protein